MTSCVLTVLGSLTAAHLVFVLFTGGHRFSVMGIPVGVSRVTPTVIALLILVLARSRCGLREVGPNASVRRDAGILFAAVLLVYLANGRTMPEGDSTPARYLPLSILREGTFDLDEFRFLYAEGKPEYLLLVRGHHLSGYPVGAALMALPIYLPSTLGGVDPQSAIVGELEKLAAATIVALSAAVLYLSLRRLTGRMPSVAITIVYAMATSSLSVSSQALWQHGPSQLALTGAIYGLLRAAGDPRWSMLAGFSLAFSLIARPIDLLIAVPLGVYVIVHHRRRFWSFVLAGAPPVAFQLWYNAAYFGSPLRSQLPNDIPSPFEGWLWDTPLWSGLTGLLFSPSRGLFVYSPILLFSVAGAAWTWRRGRCPLLRYLGVGLILTVLAYSEWHFWWGGDTYGPRLLADVTPILALLLWPVAERMGKRRGLRYAFTVVALWPIGTHAIGAFYDDRHWTFCGPNVTFVRERLWSWTDNQLRYGFQGIVSRAVMTVRGLPTSRSEPTLLSASYGIRMPPSFSVAPLGPFTVALRAINTGRSVWHAGRDEVGAVWLVGRWWRGDAEVPESSRVAFLCADVLPGQSYRFRLALSAPPALGVYHLVLGLVSQRVVWFDQVGSPPVRLTVDVAADAPAPK